MDQGSMGQFKTFTTGVTGEHGVKLLASAG